MRLGRPLKLGLIVVACLVVLGGGFLWALPEIIRRVAIDQIPKRTGRAATIEDIDLNLFTGRMAIKKFRLGDRQGSDEIPGRDLDGKRVERNAAGIFLALHQDADDTEHRAVPAVGRQREHEIDRVTRRQPSIPITAQNAPQCHAAPGDRVLATHYHVG